jgi:hypothetical protein
LSPIDGPSVTIKAAFNNTIVMLRAPADVSFQDLRQRIMRKFVEQEGVPVSNSFTIAYVLPMHVVQPEGADPSLARSRANSLSMAGIPDLTKVRFVTCELEWKLVLSFAGNGKLALRIIDTIS